MFNYIMGEVSHVSELFYPRVILYMLSGAIGFAVLGAILGLGLSSLFANLVCAKINGAPFNVGDRVFILRGNQNGTIARVNSIGRGQDNFPVLHLESDKIDPTDLMNSYEQYRVIRLKERC